MGPYEFLMAFNLVVGVLNLTLAVRNLTSPNGVWWVAIICGGCAVLNVLGFVNALQEVAG